MSVTIDFTPQEQVWIDTQATQQDISPADVIHRMIYERLSSNGTPTYKTPQERIAAMDALAAATVGAPSLSDAAFDRESIYME